MREYGDGNLLSTAWNDKCFVRELPVIVKHYTAVICCPTQNMGDRF
jgi:hypothetical protein